MNTYKMSKACIYPTSNQLDVFNSFDLCCIDKETEDYYIGSWVLGLGFINVKFSKQYTRDLYWYEKYKYSNYYIGINSSYAFKLDIECNHYPDIMQMLEDITYANN